MNRHLANFLVGMSDFMLGYHGTDINQMLTATLVMIPVITGFTLLFVLCA